MTVCANRTDTPGSFTSCAHALGRCVCADQVTTEQIDQATTATSADAPGEGPR